MHLDAEHVPLVTESFQTITERNTTAKDTNLIYLLTEISGTISIYDISNI